MRGTRAARRLTLLIFLAMTAVVAVAPAHADLTLTPAVSDPDGVVTTPMSVQFAPGDPSRMFIVQRNGVIRVAVDGVVQDTPFLDLSSSVWSPASGADPSSEAGMVSMAFDPHFFDFGDPGYGKFFVYYVAMPTSGQQNGWIHVDEFTMADPSSNDASTAVQRTVLIVPHDDAFNHYGGTIHFGPDGYLYIGTGDGGDYYNIHHNAQNPETMLGKLLRIDPLQDGGNPYSVPSDNEFPASDGLCNNTANVHNCPEIAAMGLRNPFQWSFDSGTGDMVIGDVGQAQWEEVDWIPSSTSIVGLNFGWPCREGPVAATATATGGPYAQAPCRTGDTPPVFTDPVDWYGHTGGPFAITGGVVVRDPDVPTLNGRYIYADFFAGKIHSLSLPDSKTSDRLEVLPVVTNLVSFGTDPDKHVYVVSLKGPIYRLGETVTQQPPGDGSGNQAPPGSTPPAGDPGPVQQSVPASTTPLPAQLDTRAPRLTLRARHKQAVLGSGRVRFVVGADEACTARLSATARGHRLRGMLLRLTRGNARTYELAVSKRVRRALAHRGNVAIKVRAVDAAGNATTRSLTISVSR
jgi:glucose/arabinose dehydrogenase